MTSWDASWPITPSLTEAAEMVAAALQVAHAEIAEQLPAGTASPIGWRFMDKFVQLPVLLREI